MGGCAGSASAAAARARGAGGSAPELGHCGSGSPRLRCAPAWGAPRHRLRLCCFGWPVFPSSGSQGKAWGAGLECRLLSGCIGCGAAAERVLDPAGRPRPSPGGQRQREGGLTGAGVEAVPASHLQPRWPAPGSAERTELGFSFGGRCLGQREACSPGKWDTEPNRAGRETCRSGQGRECWVTFRLQVSAARPGVHWVPSRASAWRGPALCQPRAAGTRTHPCCPWIVARPCLGGGERGESEAVGGPHWEAPGEVPVADPFCGLRSGLGVWARAPVNLELME